MNQRLRVWVSATGDSRLVRFQQDVASALGLAGTLALPPFVPLGGPPLTPTGPVTVVGWGLEDSTPVLTATAGPGQTFVVHLGLPGGWSAQDLGRLPPCPNWTFRRGRLATLVTERPRADGAILLWSWEALSGWKVDPPTR